MITSINTQNVLELLNAGDVRKFSIGSQTDEGKTSFANKTMQQLGDKVEQIGLGYTCRKGLKPESPNQDSWMVLKVESNFSFYAVFDGHGQKGHDVSNFVKETLPKLIIKDSRFNNGNGEGEQIKSTCIDSFKKVQGLIQAMSCSKKMDANLSGTTATLAIHCHESNKIVMAHVADSTAVLGKYTADDKKELTAIPLTRDHKPDLPDERSRIEKAGGRVVFDGYANHRIYAKNARYPGLNMSRCLGDLMGHKDCGISCIPEVMEHQVSPEDHVLLVCSDGVWEFIEPQEAVKFVGEYPPAKAMVAAEKLAKEAWDRWIREEGGAVVDDITVVLIYLQAIEKPSH